MYISLLGAFSIVTLGLVACLVLLFYQRFKRSSFKIWGFVGIFLFAVVVNSIYYCVISEKVEDPWEITVTQIAKDTGEIIETLGIRNQNDTTSSNNTTEADNIGKVPDAGKSEESGEASEKTFFSILFSSINNSLSIFFPSRGNYRISDRLQNYQWFLILYYLSHLLAYVYFALLAISVIYAGRRMINRARDWWWLHPKNVQQYVFVGANEASILLARDLSDKKDNISVVFYMPYSEINDNELFEQLDSLGFIVRYVPFDGSNIFKISPENIKRCRACFFLDNNEDASVKLALKFVHRLKQIGLQQELDVYVRAEIEDIDLLFEKKSNDTEKAKKLHIHVFNQSDITARQFVIDHPMLNAPQSECNENNILILGFGHMGRELLKKSVCDAQYSDKRLSATVIDEHFERRYSDFLFRCAEAVEKYRIDFNPEGVNHARSKDFFSWLLKDNALHLKRFNRIFVTLGDSRLNIDVAQTICNLRRNNGLGNSKEVIFAHIKETGAYTYFDECNQGNKSITTFGNPDKIYTVDVVVNETVDMIAKVLHYKWDEQSKGEGLSENESWNNASLYEQNSSRAAAAGLWNIPLKAGYKFTKIQKNQPVNPPHQSDQSDQPHPIITIINDRIEQFARYEHRRWNAYMRLEGILPMNPETINDNDPQSSKDIDGKIVEHICLVEYDELDPLENLLNEKIERYNENHKDIPNFKDREKKRFKEYDKNNITYLFDYLRNTGWWVEKI
ncbi:MAG: hypothetical protein FWG84_05740 [Bacteroidales bacterium]|nr:hypothetical protein [Bacteroidales bacterium]